MLPEPATPLAPEFRFAAMDLGDAVQREAAVALQCASNDSGFEPEHYRRHRERQMARYAAMLAAGLGGWSGIWRGDQLLADCGLFRRAAPGRFRHVGTPAAWRRRGLCSALIHGVTRHGLDEIGLQRLIMYGDPYDVTIGIHETVGYRREGRYWGVTGALLARAGTTRAGCAICVIESLYPASFPLRSGLFAVKPACTMWVSHLEEP